MAVMMMNAARYYDEMQRIEREIREEAIARQAQTQQANANWGNNQQNFSISYNSLQRVTMSGIAGQGYQTIWTPSSPWTDPSPAIAEKDEKVPAKPKVSDLKPVEVAELDMENGRVGLALEVEDILGYTVLRDDVKAPSRLLRVLAALEIEVYDQKSVSDYKDRMKLHFQAKANNAERDAIKKHGFIRTTTVVSWKMVELSKYTKPVPEHILMKCLSIKKAVPEVQILVDELTSEKKTLDPFVCARLGGETLYFEVYDEPEFEKEL